jgi:hypothetical protein
VVCGYAGRADYGSGLTRRCVSDAPYSGPCPYVAGFDPNERSENVGVEFDELEVEPGGESGSGGTGPAGWLDCSGGPPDGKRRCGEGTGGICGTDGNASKMALSKSGDGASDEPPEETDIHDVGRAGAVFGGATGGVPVLMEEPLLREVALLSEELVPNVRCGGRWCMGGFAFGVYAGAESDGAGDRARE